MTDIQTKQDLDASLVESAFQNLATSANLAAFAVTQQQNCRVIKWNKAAADGTAATATTATMMDDITFAGKLGILPSATSGVGTVIGAYIKVDATLTGDPTNNATFTVQWVDATGANPVTVATLTTTATLTKWVRASLTLTAAANQFVPSGGTWTIAISKGGTGVIVPANTSIYLLVRDA